MAAAPVLEQWSTTATPGVRFFGYDRAAVTAGIAHIGVGNFFRVHGARYVDDCLHLPGQSDWGIVGIGVQQSAQGKAKAATYAAQDNLYTVTEYTAQGQRSARVIGAMIDYRYVPDDPAAVVDLLSSSAIRIVTMTLTEGGYFRDEATGEFDATHPDIQRDAVSPLPRTVFGLLTAALRRRLRAGTAPFTVVSCDNLRGNGRTARDTLVGFARITDPDLADWIETAVAFPDSMVDRIAPNVDTKHAQQVGEAPGSRTRCRRSPSRSPNGCCRTVSRPAGPAWTRSACNCATMSPTSKRSKAGSSTPATCCWPSRRS